MLIIEYELIVWCFYFKVVFPTNIDLNYKCLDIKKKKKTRVYIDAGGIFRRYRTVYRLNKDIIDFTKI